MSNGMITEPTERTTVYKPLGSQDSIELSLALMKRLVITPTKSGKLPSDDWIRAAIAKCKSMGLNPLEGDVYIVGYDSQNGPTFSFLTSIQAYLKRAEITPSYDGMESGVIVETDGVLRELEGDFVPYGSVLAGGWAIVHRSDRKYPSKEKLSLATYDSKQSRWKIDPAGMIVKCAEASALRKAFPSQFGGTMMQYEMDRQMIIEGEFTRKSVEEQPAIEGTKTERVAAMLPKPRRGQEFKPEKQEKVEARRETKPAEQPKQQHEEQSHEVAQEEPPPQQQVGHDGESDAWKSFKALYEKCKNIADLKRLRSHAIEKNACKLSDAELQDAGMTIDSAISGLEESK